MEGEAASGLQTATLVAESQTAEDCKDGQRDLWETRGRSKKYPVRSAIQIVLRGCSVMASQGRFPRGQALK